MTLGTWNRCGLCFFPLKNLSTRTIYIFCINTICFCMSFVNHLLLCIHALSKIYEHTARERKKNFLNWIFNQKVFFSRMNLFLGMVATTWQFKTNKSFWELINSIFICLGFRNISLFIFWWMCSSRQWIVCITRVQYVYVFILL